MKADLDDDFFYEEDKINASNACSQAPTGNENATIPATQPVDDIVGSDEMKTTIVCAGASGNDEFFELNKQKFEIERLGMTVSTKSVVLTKDESNLIGISIGGGAPLCPCLYIVQIFDGTPAAREGSLESGDELLAINNISVKGKTKVQVAKMIQTASQQVTIHYNKLHADPERGKSLDIILKKLKHRIVDNMSSNTADTLGLSRAILCNDSLVKRLEELEGTEIMYKGMVEHAKRMIKGYYELFHSYRCFGDCFAEISIREPQMRASEVFRTFGEFHRHLEKDGLEIIKQIKPILNDMGTYLHKAIPDTKLTVKRYMDSKFTYLSYCLKVKEMDDEEHGFAYIQEPLYRVETGNYEYRLILRCRQDARFKFAQLRTDVLEKMELLECKHANDLASQLRGLLENLKQLHLAVVKRMDSLPHLFPIEVDFKESDFQYKSKILDPQPDDDTEEELRRKIESPKKDNTSEEEFNEVICGVEALEEPAAIINIRSDEKGPPSTVCNPENESLLKDLGLLGISLNVESTNAEIKNEDENSNANDSTALHNNLSAQPCNFELFLNQNSANSPNVSDSNNEAFRQDLMAANAEETDLLLQ